MPTAAHFIYIPGVLILGVVIGWILGSRTAADAYASELRKRGASPKPQTPNPKSQHQDAKPRATHALVSRRAPQFLQNLASGSRDVPQEAQKRAAGASPAAGVEASRFAISFSTCSR